MIIKLRKSKDRGYFDHGWLRTHHTFSFGEYRSPAFMGFKTLRVINEDYVNPGVGFPTHPHHDMEIITYVISGELQHKDSMGNGSVIKPGEVQYMCAGTGVTHSEFNPSKDKPLHLLQIWILPPQKNLPTSYAQEKLSSEKNKWLPTIKLHQGAKIFACKLEAEKTIEYSMATDRAAWVQLISGKLLVQGQSLEAGDGASIENVQSLEFKAHENSEFLLFDL